MHPNGGELRPTHEVDDARWVSYDEAERMLSYERDRVVLRSAASALMRVRVRPGSYLPPPA